MIVGDATNPKRPIGPVDLVRLGGGLVTALSVVTGLLVAFVLPIRCTFVGGLQLLASSFLFVIGVVNRSRSIASVASFTARMPRELNIPTPRASPSVVKMVIFFHRLRSVRNFIGEPLTR